MIQILYKIIYSCLKEQQRVINKHINECLQRPLTFLYPQHKKASSDKCFVHLSIATQISMIISVWAIYYLFWHLLHPSFIQGCILSVYDAKYKKRIALFGDLLLYTPLTHRNALQTYCSPRLFAFVFSSVLRFCLVGSIRPYKKAK